MLLPIAAVVISGVLAIVAAERGVRWMQLVFKPLTTILLFWVLGPPASGFAKLIAAGIALSLVGDVALLWPGNGPFLVGLAAFLLAHVAYVIAFLDAAVLSPHVIAVAVVTAACTVVVLRAIWKGAAGLHAPTVAYGVTISAMVIAASAMVGGPRTAAPFAAVGAVLFYASDASLALNRFHSPIRHAAILTFGIYWIGQLGIAVAAR